MHCRAFKMIWKVHGAWGCWGGIGLPVLSVTNETQQDTLLFCDNVALPRFNLHINLNLLNFQHNILNVHFKSET